MRNLIVFTAVLAITLLGSAAMADTQEVMPVGETIDSRYFDGNVGIGTTGPGYKLHITGGDIMFDQAGGRLQLWTPSNYFQLWDNQFKFVTNAVKGFTFNGGNVGIGTTDPLVSLHNNGDFITKGPWVDVRAYASFSDAIDTIGFDKKTLLIPNQQNISASKTVPSNVTLRFLQGGSLNISAATTVTINGHVDAGLYQIFSGLGSVSFGSSGTKEVYPQWWGAAANGSTNDQAAIQAAITAITSTGGTVRFPSTNTNYLIGSALTMTSNVNMIGEGLSTIKLQNSANDVMVKFSNATADVIISGIIFDGNRANQIWSSSNGAWVMVRVSVPCSRITLRDCTFKNATYDVFNGHDSKDIKIINNSFIDYDCGAIGFTNSTRSVISGNSCDNTAITLNTSATRSPAVIGVNNCVDMVISNNMINLNSGLVSPYDVETGIGIGDSVATVTGNTIDGNDGTQTAGMTISGVSPTTITGNIIRNTGTTGLGALELVRNNTGGTPNGTVISGNMFLDIGNGIMHTGSGAVVYNLTNITISNNTFNRYTGNAISLTPADGSPCRAISITGNVFTNGTGILGLNPAINLNGGMTEISIVANTFKTSNDRGVVVQGSDGTGLAPITNLIISANMFDSLNQAIRQLTVDTSYLTVIGNIIRNDTNASIITGGSNYTVRDNVGVGYTIPALTSGVATPSVASGHLFRTAGTTTITNFTGSYQGQEITILAETSITITDGTNIFLNGSANFNMTPTDSLSLVQKADGNWYETGRSDN